jgi:transposase
MGTKARLFIPLPPVTLEELVPADHFYRHLDRMLDLSFVRDLVQDCYTAGLGRPSADPVVFFRLQLVMFFEGIRSERQLMRLAADRLSVLWYLGYDINGPLPDHSTLTRIRTRYGIEVFRRFFDVILEQCRQAGLVWGRELSCDSTQVQANAALSSLTPRFAVEAHKALQARTEARKALEAHLDALFADADALQAAPPPAPAQEPPNPGGADTVGDPTSGPDGKAGPSPLSGAPEQPQEPTAPPVVLPEELQEELSTANAERHDWVAQLGAQDRRVTGRTYRRVADFLVSTTDPDATMMHSKGPADMGYHAHFVVDGGKARIIHTVLVTPTEVMDNHPMLDLLWHTCFHRHLWPHQVTGDRTYGTEENLVAIEAQGIRAYAPQADLDHRTEFFAIERFTYDPDRDVYVCPAGEDLRFDRPHSTERQLRYRARAADCNHCPLKAQCTRSQKGRTVCRSVDEVCLRTGARVRIQ